MFAKYGPGKRATALNTYNFNWTSSLTNWCEKPACMQYAIQACWPKVPIVPETLIMATP